MAEEEDFLAAYADYEELREALTLLLEHYWLVREHQPEAYSLIRRHEADLRRYVFEKCGWHLLQHPQFYKLEKIPAQPQSWMGLRECQQPRDYALLCTMLAFIEEKDVEDQFLLSDLCDSLLALYPHEQGCGGRLNWENYEHRRSLVRALQVLVALGALRLVDGDSEQFAMRQEGEALYEITVLSRYLLRAYPKDMQAYHDMQALQAAESFDDDAVTGKGRRVRIYRQLLLTPVYSAADARSEDFSYLRNMQRRLREEMENYTGLQLELYKDCVMLTSPERSGWCSEIFPSQRSGLHAVLLHAAALYRRERLETGGDKPLSSVDFEGFIERCRTCHGSGWTKEYRELPLSRLAVHVLEELVDWGMAVCDPVTGFIELRPALGRLQGQYPDDYLAKQGRKEEVAE